MAKARSRARLGTVLAALVLTVGCGSPQEQADRGSRGCTAADVADRGRVVAMADLDGDGAPETVRLVSGDAGACRHSLVAVVGRRVVRADVRGLDLAPTPAAVVGLRGSGAPDLVLLRSTPHPRGGTQPHLFGAGGPGGLVEVTLDGSPVLPFLAADGGGSRMTATCTPSGGIAVDTATVHEPPGTVLAWDVTRTTYGVRAGRAVPTGARLVAQAMADPALRRRMPALFSHALFAGCR